MASVGILCSFLSAILTVLIFEVSISAGVTTTEPDNTCASQPCENGGTCVRLRQAYVCQCMQGYVGLRCETPESEQEQTACASQPCVHGICHSTNPSQYTCMCVPGWKGSNCNIDENECASGNPCSSKQNCVNLIGSFECKCPPGFTGDDCSKDICTSEPCRNGGKCTRAADTELGYTCQCPEGFSGHDCQASACRTNYCLNGGTCYETNASRFCACSLGYSGHFCETKEIGCSSQPCKNGGSCLQSLEDPNGYMCECDLGYTGRLCDQRLQAVCYYNGESFLHGEIRIAQCNKCHCKFGSWLCTTKFCGTIEVTFDFSEEFSLLTGRISQFKQSFKSHLAESVNIKTDVIQNLEISPGSINIDFILVANADPNLDIEKTAADVQSLLDSGHYIFPFEGHAFHVDIASVKLTKHELAQNNEQAEPLITHTLLVVVCVVVSATLVLAVIAGLIAIFVKRSKSEKTAVGQFATEINLNNTRHHNNLQNSMYNSVRVSDDESDDSEPNLKDVNIYKTTDFCY